MSKPETKNEEIKQLVLTTDADNVSKELANKFVGITSLDLAWSDFENIDILVNFPNLTNLDLGGCDALKNLDIVSSLINLTSLNLACCYKLQNLGGLAGLTKLTSLELRNCNNLKNVDALTNLTNLTSLNLSWCKSLKNADIIGSLTKLENLNLSCCENLINVDGLANCINLTALELEYCQFLRNIDALAHCTELIVLNLNFRESPLNLNALAGMKNLIKLSLGGHHLSSLSPKLGQLVKLEHLRLFGNDFTELFPGFGNLKNMKALDLSYCKNIADDALGPISRLVNLEELDLYGCENISDGGLAHLSKNVNLKRLDLIVTQATEKAVEKLQSRLPELTILWQLFEKNLLLCANPRTDSDQLAEIYNTFITEEQDTTLIDWLSEKIMWEEIVDSQRIELAEALAGNPKCTSPVLTNLFDLPERNEEWGWPDDNPLQLNVLSNPGCPVSVLLKVIKGGNDELKEAAAKSPAVKKLKPVGFGRYADPETGEIVAIDLQKEEEELEQKRKDQGKKFIETLLKRDLMRAVLNEANTAIFSQTYEIEVTHDQALDVKGEQLEEVDPDADDYDPDGTETVRISVDDVIDYDIKQFVLDHFTIDDLDSGVVSKKDIEDCIYSSLSGLCSSFRNTPIYDGDDDTLYLEVETPILSMEDLNPEWIDDEYNLDDEILADYIDDIYM